MPAPAWNFAIVSQYRSGSSVLAELLRTNAALTVFNEVYGPGTIDLPAALLKEMPFSRTDVDWRNDNMEEFLGLLLARTSGRTAGVRLHPTHTEAAKRMIAQEKRTRKLILRRNPLMTYSSWRLAVQTKVWFAHERPAGFITPPLRFKADEFWRWVERERDFLAPFMAGDHLMVQYSDMMAPATLAAVSDYLEVPGFSPEAPNMVWRTRLHGQELTARFQNMEDVRTELLGTELEYCLEDEAVAPAPPEVVEAAAEVAVTVSAPAAAAAPARSSRLETMLASLYAA